VIYDSKLFLYCQIKKYFLYLFFTIFAIHQTNKHMEEKQRQKPGRKKLPEDQRKLIVTAYLTADEKRIINEKFGNLSKAVRTLLNNN
jgi:hypothetical protein